MPPFPSFYHLCLPNRAGPFHLAWTGRQVLTDVSDPSKLRARIGELRHYINAHRNALASALLSGVAVDCLKLRTAEPKQCAECEDKTHLLTQPWKYTLSGAMATLISPTHEHSSCLTHHLAHRRNNPERPKDGVIFISWAQLRRRDQADRRGACPGPQHHRQGRRRRWSTLRVALCPHNDALAGDPEA